VKGAHPMALFSRLVLASANEGKLREFRRLLAPLDIEVIAQTELRIGDTDEPHTTFVENALAKARHASRATGLPALADDSGLCVDALGGEPGVHSAYYAGRDGGRVERDARNNAKLLAALGARLGENRSAYYCCLAVLVRHADDPRPVIAEGLWHGEITRAPRGANGFGYDPLFFLPALGKTAAELSPADKNRISHRALALNQLVELLHASDHA
jgi:XTP/dITP diphosphohydrolase